MGSKHKTIYEFTDVKEDSMKINSTTDYNIQGNVVSRKLYEDYWLADSGIFFVSNHLEEYEKETIEEQIKKTPASHWFIYNDNGDLIEKHLHGTRYTYNYHYHNGKVSKRDEYSDGSFRQRTIYNYDANGNKISELTKTVSDYVEPCDDGWRTRYIKDQSERIFIYRKCGNLLEEKILNNNCLTSKISYNEDNGGFLVERHIRAENPEDGLIYYKRYDSGRKLIESWLTDYYCEEPEITRYEYEFDKNGNWVTQTAITNDIKQITGIRIIVYY